LQTQELHKLYYIVCVVACRRKK